MSYLLLIAAIFLYAPGCSHLPGLLGPINDAFGVLCSTRAELLAAHDALEAGNVPLAIELTKQYLAEHGADKEVLAVLRVLETQASQ